MLVGCLVPFLGIQCSGLGLTLVSVFLLYLGGLNGTPAAASAYAYHDTESECDLGGTPGHSVRLRHVASL